MEDAVQKSDHDLLVRIDERTNALHSLLAGVQSTLDKKVDREAFQGHTKEINDAFKSSDVTIDRMREKIAKTDTKVSWLYGIVAVAGIIFGAILHFKF